MLDDQMEVEKGLVPLKFGLTEHHGSQELGLPGVVEGPGIGFFCLAVCFRFLCGCWMKMGYWETRALVREIQSPVEIPRSDLGSPGSFFLRSHLLCLVQHTPPRFHSDLRVLYFASFFLFGGT